jgi:hypothetical protein
VSVADDGGVTEVVAEKQAGRLDRDDGQGEPGQPVEKGGQDGPAVGMARDGRRTHGVGE